MAQGQPANNLKARRTSASISADELARRTGLSLRSILLAEDAVAKGSPGTVLSASDLKRIADVLSTTVADIKG